MSGEATLSHNVSASTVDVHAPPQLLSCNDDCPTAKAGAAGTEAYRKQKHKEVEVVCAQEAIQAISMAPGNTLESVKPYKTNRTMTEQERHSDEYSRMANE